MKKDMTTFEMAQAAYENPGKVFVGRGPEPHSEIEATYDRYVKNIRSGNSLNLQCHQADGYVWNEKVEPRKWSGEYVYDCETVRITEGRMAGESRPDVKGYRVKWEAEEVL